MKLSFNSREVLVLHDLLQSTVVTGSPFDRDDDCIKQLYARVRGVIVSALNAALTQGDRPNPLDAFMAREQQKIDALRAKSFVVQDAKAIARAVGVKDDVCLVDADDASTVDYPRRRKGPGGRPKGEHRR